MQVPSCRFQLSSGLRSLEVSLQPSENKKSATSTRTAVHPSQSQQFASKTAASEKSGSKLLGLPPAIALYRILPQCSQFEFRTVSIKFMKELSNYLLCDGESVVE